MSSEKTEPPSHKKLNDARRKGDVAHSKDFTQTLLILSLLAYLVLRGRAIFETLAALVLFAGRISAAASAAASATASATASTFSPVPPLSFSGAVAALGREAAGACLDIVAPFLLIVIGVGVFAETVQVGVLLAFEKLKPSAKKLNPAANLKNIVSKKNLIEFVKSVVKIGFLSVLVWRVVAAALPELFTLPRAGVDGVFASVGVLMTTLLLNVAVAYVALGVADLAWQRYLHRQGLRMSKDDVKREYKEMEGDPHVRSMRRNLQKEMAMQGATAGARRASVLITNPTHYAVAIYYEAAETPLPIVLAKGEGALAQRMIDEAREAGVPVLRDIPLARALSARAEIAQYIPETFIEPVAEVLRLVRQWAEEADARDASAAPLAGGRA
ncbi:EscU/YscU/HrcU family type III secretion system export apparatus switch protein [Robbsia sp. Bb-Pol-6]|uniref:EscU/YscU/HrcU family type III secretion system export apparatus switch protein n=1 Tax=Robbsia betulipollinis TaxID=2981849 RepID=A0ABT3ZL83_9BURK|nr:EscU/YscU/HrcU family type III secretion system export apparatus switch protein [Robbsia betulipollinis]MCY0387289.1 EscU/YscU/HrcU family type III secretion system export apparatus switch protein [Robbsia betulipollinis]